MFFFCVWLVVVHLWAEEKQSTAILTTLTRVSVCFACFFPPLILVRKPMSIHMMEQDTTQNRLSFATIHYYNYPLQLCSNSMHVNHSPHSCWQLQDKTNVANAANVELSIAMVVLWLVDWWLHSTRSAKNAVLPRRENLRGEEKACSCKILYFFCMCICAFVCACLFVCVCSYLRRLNFKDREESKAEATFSIGWVDV